MIGMSRLLSGQPRKLIGIAGLENLNLMAGMTSGCRLVGDQWLESAGIRIGAMIMRPYCFLCHRYFVSGGLQSAGIGW